MSKKKKQKKSNGWKSDRRIVGGLDGGSRTRVRTPQSASDELPQVINDKEMEKLLKHLARAHNEMGPRMYASPITTKRSRTGRLLKYSIVLIVIAALFIVLIHFLFAPIF